MSTQPPARDPSASAAPHYGLVLAERFRVEGLLGMGGMGVVYRAHDIHLDVPVALKMLRPELAGNAGAFERFRQELLLARQVSSPHVVRIHDIAQHEGHWLISMDLIEGQSLEKIIEQRGPLPVEEAIGLIHQLAQGLDAAHQRGVVHRDLKPANIMVDAEGRAYISDFGVARSVGAAGLTQSGAVVGTPEYLSPEQARAEPADQRSDLYSLALIGYEMLAGKLPFSGGTPAESTMQRIVRAPPPVTDLRADVPAWVARLLERMLRPEPRERLQSAQALIEAIENRKLPRERRRPVTRRVLAVAATILAAAALVVLAWRLPSPVAAPPSLQRLVVLPLAANDGSDLAERLHGATEHLRWWIAEHHQAVVDGERTAHALALLGADSGTGTPEPGRMHEPAGAAVVVSGRWVDEGGHGGHVVFEVHRADAAPVAVRGSTQPPDRFAHGYRDAGMALLRELEMPQRPAAIGLPEDPQALQAYGQGLRARGGGDHAAAMEHFAQASRLDPAFVPAWLSLAQSARAAGREEDALAAALEGTRHAQANQALARSPHAQQLEALRRSIEGDPAAAVALLGQLASERPGDAQLALLLAEAESDAGRFQEAATRLQDLAQRDPDDARVWFLLGKVSILRGEARRAVDDYLVRALVLFNRSRNPAGQADTANALGVGYERLGQVDRAIEQYRLAVDLRRRQGDPRGLASSLRNLAALAAIRGEFQLAEDNLSEATRLLQELGDRQGLASLANDLGLLAEERGDFATALAHFRDALQLRQAIGHSHGVAESLNNVGYSHFQLGSYDDASVYWRQALDSFQATGDLTGIVRARQNLATLDLARGDWDQAQAALAAVLQQAEREQMVEEAAVSLRFLAELALLRGRAAEALPLLERADVLFSGREDRRGMVDVALLRARSALLQQRFELARALLKPVLGRRARLSPVQRAELLLVAADVELRSGRGADAMRLLQAAGAQVDRAGVPVHALHRRILELGAADSVTSEQLLQALEEAQRMGNAQLLLRAQEVALQRSLDGDGDGDGADVLLASRLYGEAQRTLRRVGDYAYAGPLHQMGALALERSGDPAAARAAHAAAEAAALPVDAGSDPGTEPAPGSGDATELANGAPPPRHAP